MKRLFLTLIALLQGFCLFAQGQEVEMADVMRRDGKIYVVVACILVILVGLLIYLFALDKRIKMLEKKSASKN